MQASGMSQLHRAAENSPLTAARLDATMDLRLESSGSACLTGTVFRCG